MSTFVKISLSSQSLSFIHAALVLVSSPFCFPLSTQHTDRGNTKKKKKTKQTLAYSLVKKMSEFAMSNAKKPGLASFDLVSDMLNVLFFVLSNPLYFSYLIFFSPYLIKLLSFLSPLFVTTALLVLAFLTTVSPSLLHDDHSLDANPGFLPLAYRVLVERLRPKAGGFEGLEGEEQEENYFPRFEEFEVYKIVFDTSSLSGIMREDNVVAMVLEEDEPVDKCLIVNESGVGDGGDDSPVKVKQLEGVETLKWCLEEEKKEWENTSPKKVDAKVRPWNDVEAKKEELFLTRSESKAGFGAKSVKEESGANYFASPEWDFDDKYLVKSSSMDGSPTSNGSQLGSFGSMRKEKEWRRTLACKLFEERHNAVEGSEGMDLLWETYENEANKSGQGKGAGKAGKGGPKRGKKGVLDYSEEDEEEDEYEDEANGQLCCLQALKFSAGKVNLGMGRPNLVKISKAFKGIGWLHNVTRHAKKRCNN